MAGLMKILARFLCTLLLAAAVLSPSPLSAQTSTMGRDFWVMFLYNCDPNWWANDPAHANDKELSLIASGPDNATINVSCGSWSTTATLTAGGHTTITVPYSLMMMPSGSIENNGIHVTSTADISLYASNYIYRSYDIATVLPTTALRSRYLSQNYTGGSNEGDAVNNMTGSEIGVVAVEDGTEIRFELTESDRYHAAGSTHTVTLNAGQSYQLLSPPNGNFSGTKVTSTNGKPFAMFQGTRLTQVPSGSVMASDHLYEQAIPVEYWGKDFLIVPEIRDVTDIVRVTSADDNCEVRQGATLLTTLSAGETFEFGLLPGVAKRLTCTKPVAVGLYFRGGAASSNTGDPGLVMVPPLEQGVYSVVFEAHNTVATTQHYANVVTTTADVAGMTLDGSSIASQFTPNGAGLSYAKLSVTPGTHSLGNSMGKFTAWFYGLGEWEGYAYIAGMSLKQLRNEWTVNAAPHNLTGDTITACYQDTIEFAVAAATEDHAIRWYVDDILQSESSLTLRCRFPAVADTHTVMAVMHGDCAPDWCDTLSIAVITRVPQSDTFAVVPDTLLWYGNVYDESGIYTRVASPTPPDGCDSLVVLHLTVTGYPDNVFDVDCTVPADSNAFEMTPLYQTDRNVATMSTPMVADMDGDGMPEIVACQFFSSGNNSQKQYYSNGIRVFNGQTGAEKYSFNTESYSLSHQGICLADVNGDHSTEVFILCTDRKVRCYSSTGTLLWTSIVLDKRYLPTVADLMADGHVQVVCGPYIFNAQDGTLLLQGTPVVSGTGYGTMINSSGLEEPCVFSLGDIDDDGKLEICAGLAFVQADAHQPYWHYGQHLDGSASGSLRCLYHLL